ncbi:MAG: hypothetical protein HOM20_12395, partial [Porticoccaceae bacterium]|nr:hypothetical protein [Porticoccaceae bacterium]
MTKAIELSQLGGLLTTSDTAITVDRTIKIDEPSGNTATLTVQTQASSGNDAVIKIRGARTNAPDNHIAMLQFDNKTSSAYTMATISARDFAGDDTLGDGSLLFRTSDNGTLSDSMTILSGGNVGIGTSSPQVTLHVLREDNIETARFERTGAGNRCGIGFVTAGTASTVNIGSKADAFTVELANSEKFRVTSAGNVGIGTIVPSERLEVDGVILSSGPIVDTVWYKETWPAYNETTATLAGNDLGTWTLTGGTLATGTATQAEVDTANLPSGLTAVRWNGASAVSYLTSPTVDLSDFRTNEKITTVNQTGSLADRSVSDSRIYLTMLLAAQSMDSNAEHMEVQLSNDNGVTFHEHQAFVWQDNSADNDDITDTTWRKVVIDISEYTYAPPTASSYGFKIRFMGTGAGTGDSYGVSNIY